MALGGARPGAGRKKGFAALQAEQSRKIFAETVAPKVTELASVLLAKALDGDIPATKELLDRAWGKPQAFVDHTSDGEKLPTPIMTLDVCEPQ